METPSDGGSAIAKVYEDHRGAHWRGKFDTGVGPNISSYVVVWASRSASLESRLRELLKSLKLDQSYQLPWRRLVSVHIGNTSKVLFMQLLIYHLSDVVKLHFSDGFGALGESGYVSVTADFLGIKQVEILKPDVFNANECGIRTIAWAKTHMSTSKAKTITKHWHTIGLHALDNADGLETYEFQQSLRDKHVTSMKKRVATEALSSSAAGADDTAQTKRTKRCSVSALIEATRSIIVDVYGAGAADADGGSALDLLSSLSAAVEPSPGAGASNAPISAILNPAPSPPGTPPDDPLLRRRLVTAQQRVLVAEMRADASEHKATAADLRADAAEMEAKISGMRADAARLDDKAAKLRAVADEVEKQPLV